MTDIRFSFQNPNYEAAARQSFGQQGIMTLLGASMKLIQPGRCIIELPFNETLTQQDGYFHAGVTSTIADSAGGYAALSLMSEGSRVLTVEFKINLVAPANGDVLIADATVLKPGKTLTVSVIHVNTVENSNETLCAVVQQTAICLHPRH